MVAIGPNTNAVTRAILSQVDWWWAGLYEPRVVGLSDEELVWSPVEPSWSVHPLDDGRARIDYHWPPPQPPPFTTIAWRLAHIGLMLAGRTTRYFPDHAPEVWDKPPHTYTLEYPTTADGALVFVERWWQGWRAGLEAGGDERLWQPYAAAEGNFPEMNLSADDPFVNMVLHTHRELMHHGAEIAVLRDLYLAQQPRDEYVDALLRSDVATIERLEGADPGITTRYRTERPDLPMRAAETERMDAFELLAERGFDLNALVNGHTALHHLIAHGDLALVHAAVSLGADPTVRDSATGGDGIAWAEHFNHPDIADYLRQR